MLLADRSWFAPYWNGGANWIWNISPNLINNLAVGYNSLNSVSHSGLRTSSGGPVSYSAFGMDVAEPTTTPPGLDSLAVGGEFSAGQNTNVINRHQYSIAESVTWNKGST